MGKRKYEDPSLPARIQEFCILYCNFRMKVGTGSKAYKEHIATPKHIKNFAIHWQGFITPPQGEDLNMAQDQSQSQSQSQDQSQDQDQDQDQGQGQGQSQDQDQDFSPALEEYFPESPPVFEPAIPSTFPPKRAAAEAAESCIVDYLQGRIRERQQAFLEAMSATEVQDHPSPAPALQEEVPSLFLREIPDGQTGFLSFF